MFSAIQSAFIKFCLLFLFCFSQKFLVLFCCLFFIFLFVFFCCFCRIVFIFCFAVMPIFLFCSHINFYSDILENHFLIQVGSFERSFFQFFSKKFFNFFFQIFFSIIFFTKRLLFFSY